MITPKSLYKGARIAIVAPASCLKVEGEEREKLESLISDLKLNEKVILAGKDSHAIEKVAKSEIFVFTSRYEGMPNALLEAMACGLPCISTDCIAGPSEIIENNKNGILVEVDNVDEIAEKIIYIIENKDIANELGKNARKVKEDYSIDNIFNKYYNFIKDEDYLINPIIPKIIYYF